MKTSTPPKNFWLTINRKTTGLSLLIALLLILPGNPTFAQSSSQSKFDWIRSARILLVDAYTYPLHPKIEFDAEKMAETMVDMHFNTVRIATSGFYWLIPGTKFDTAPNLGNRDILAECLAACKPRGVKVVAYLRTGGPVAPEVMRPEWAYRVNPEGDLYYKRHFGELMTPFCWNTSYRQAFLDLVEKVVSRYDIDGIYFDAWLLYYDYPYPKVCYCQGCKDGFKEATGLELPYRRNVNEYTAEELKTIDRYHDWCRAKLAEIFQETKRLIKSYKDIPLIFNLNSASNINNTSYTDPSIVEGCDAFLYENTRCMLERAEGVSLAVSHGLAVWPYVGAIDGYPRIVSNNYELTQQIYTTIVFGGAPILYQNYSYVDYPDERKPVKEAFYILEKNKSYIENFYPQKFCAVVWNKKDPPGHANKGWVWQTNARNCTTGAFAACIYNHIQTTSFLKEDLNNSELLNQYQVLYLPDICYLSDKQIANIKNFVRQGGGLVMTYATSLYDKEGRKRSDFALGEMARIQYLNPDKKMAAKIAANLSYGGAWDLYMKTRPGQQVIKPPLADNLIPAFRYEPVKALPGAEVAADIVVGTNMEHIFPALVVSRYGKGKVAYIPAALDAAYLQSHIRQFGDFIKDVVEYVSPAGLPFEIEAPASLIANMTSKGDTRVLHLVNWTGCKLERMQQNAYYIPPIDNIVIKYNIPQGKKIKKVALFVPGEFSHKRNDNTLYITLPKVDKYQAVIIELE
jgi:uncharacterized membrane protein